MPPLNFLIKPVSGSCNMNCSYCFYVDEANQRQVSNYGAMDDSVMQELIRKAVAKAEYAVTFLFQGGEPTLIGLPFYQRFVEYASKYAPSGLTVQYAFQTNGILLDDAWCRFFLEHHFLVGISMDGTESCHNRYRLDKSGHGTYAQTLRAVALLNKYKIPYNVLTVVTKDLAGHIQEVFDAYCNNNILFQQYIPCLEPLGEKRNQREYALSPSEYGLFLTNMFDLWYHKLTQGRYYSIRYFDNLIRMLLGHPPEQCSMVGRCGIQYLIEADGSVYPCDFYSLDAYYLGNIHEDSIEAIDQAREQLGFIDASFQIQENCRSCRWYPLCRNGCRRDRTETADGIGLNYYCESYRYFFPHAILRLERIAQWYRQYQ